MSRSPKRNSLSPNNEGDPHTGNNLYISNLSYKTQEQDLHDKFASFGKIKYCKVIRDPYTKQSRGFGFVTFESSEDASDAKASVNGTVVEGRELKIEIARRSRAYSPTPGNYLGNPKYKRSGFKGSPRRRNESPRRERSPRRRYDSPMRRDRSPRRRYESPKGRYESPRGRYESPRRRYSPRRFSPNRRSRRDNSRSRS